MPQNTSSTIHYTTVKYMSGNALVMYVTSLHPYVPAVGTHVLVFGDFSTNGVKFIVTDVTLVVDQAEPDPVIVVDLKLCSKEINHD